MKKAILTVVAILLLTVTAYAEPLCRIETSNSGNTEIVGYDLVESQGKKMLIVLLNYENTTNDSVTPAFQFIINAYDNGIQLDTAFAYDFSYDNFTDGYTNVRPGATIPYYVLFEAPATNAVEIELYELLDITRDNKKVISLDMTQLGYSAEVPKSNLGEELSNKGSDLDTYITLAETALKSGYGQNYEIYTYGTNIYFLIWGDGIGAEVSQLLAGDQSLMSSYKTMLDGTKTFAESIYDLAGSIDLNGYCVYVLIVNDLDHAETFGVFENGQLEYDKVNGYVLPQYRQ